MKDQDGPADHLAEIAPLCSSKLLVGDERKRVGAVGLDALEITDELILDLLERLLAAREVDAHHPAQPIAARQRVRAAILAAERMARIQTGEALAEEDLLCKTLRRGLALRPVAQTMPCLVPPRVSSHRLSVPRLLATASPVLYRLLNAEFSSSA